MNQNTIRLVPALAAAVTGPFHALQRHLLFPAPKPNPVLHSPCHEIEATVIGVNGKALQGYRARPTAEPLDPQRLLYFNGRREHPTSIFNVLPALPNHEVLCFFYDGLGMSWHKPGESELVADGLAVLDWWMREQDVQAHRISIAGRSLGSGIAVQVAAARPVGQLILISPHDRLISAVNAKLPWVPSWCLKDSFDSATHIGRVRCPCLVIAGDRDTTIPVETSRALFRSWNGHLAEFVVPGCGHRGLLKRSEVHRACAEFLGSARAGTRS